MVAEDTAAHRKVKPTYRAIYNATGGDIVLNGAYPSLEPVRLWSGFSIEDGKAEHRGAYPSTTRTWCSRPSSDNGTSDSPGSWVPSRLIRDTPRQAPFGFSTVIR